MDKKEFYKLLETVKTFGEQISYDEAYHHSLGIFYCKDNDGVDTLIFPNGKIYKETNFS